MRLLGEDGTIPDGWQTVRLGDVCAPPEYGASAPARPFDPDLPRFVRITDITDDGQLKPHDARSADLTKTKGYELGTGDLLFARSGSVGRTYLYRSEDGPCVFAGYLIRFRPKSQVALPRFVEIYTHSDSYRRWVASMLRAGAQPNINATEYSSLPILLPPLEQQRRIAAVLDAIDDAIKRTDDVIDATECLRDALLHALLSHGVPGWHSEWRDVPGLGTIPADWEVVRLGDVAEVVGGSTPPRDQNECWGGDIPWVVPSELTELRDRYLTDTRESITLEGMRAAGLRLMPAGSVLLTSRATIGVAAINTIPVTTNQGFQSLIVRSEANSLWLYYWVSAMRRELERRGAGSTFREVLAWQRPNSPSLLASGRGAAGHRWNA